MQNGTSRTLDLDAWLQEWGVVDPADARGGISLDQAKPESAVREITLLQRTDGKLGANLGKTTGWIHRAALRKNKVQMLAGVNYEQISDQGLMVTFGDSHEKPTWIDVDNIVLCTGQLPQRELADSLDGTGITTYVVGGADIAAELDAKRAIDQGSRLAATL